MKIPNITDLLGVRFVDHGRSISEGFDCYGLAIEVSKRFGHTLTDVWYEKGSADSFYKNAPAVLESLGNKVEPTTERTGGNLIVFFDGVGRMIHIGVILDDNHFIHCELGGVRVMRIDQYRRNKWRIYKWHD